MKQEKTPIPEFDGEYVNIYAPQGDIYNGIEINGLVKGDFYNEWVTNDFSILKDGDKWHMVGITTPKAIGFVDEFEYNPDTVHGTENQLFHCVAQGESFSDVFFKESFCECKKILYPDERPDEITAIWAPHLMKFKDEYNVIYSPCEFRRAVSADFDKWELKPYLFKTEFFAARDPYIYEENGTFYLIYTEDKYLKYRISDDMENWSDEKIMQTMPFEKGSVESPFFMKKDGCYYLFWSIFDGENGCYDNRTFVFASKTIDGFDGKAPLTVLKAHAPEIVRDNDGSYYLLSVFYPGNGISAVKLKWI